ncbi:hypothetical protein XhyaCFBP1156_12600 [Xanthomonas hyacinthi]|uniref:Uncharacterized protein n=1 Tax=Xanthomonas hyacinthi TaxID=56455 RepID=A0A2S7EVQ0_9XANT|nr:hypothetical protein Y886_08900 [Xanthomonas hyacinthi DSM 19077]PPU97187.1 hypothetical protein XhyaCFBP1156_12600 [Xanthomonas hyacinthi]
MKPIVLASCLTLFGIASLARAEQAPIATDRPDFVESSLTVGDRRLQVETRSDAVSVFRLEQNGPRKATTSATAPALSAVAPRNGAGSGSSRHGPSQARTHAIAKAIDGRWQAS